MTIYSIRPFLACGVSLLAAILIMFSGKKPNVREFWSVAAAVIKVSLIYSMVPAVLAGCVYEWTLFQLTDTIGLTLRTDPAGMVFACVSATLYVPVSFYAIGYMRGHHEIEQTGFYASFATCLCAAIGIALSANLLTFFLFYELLTVATWPLVFHERHEEARFSGRKYLIYTMIPGQLLLAGIVGVYVMAGTIDFAAGGILTMEMAPKWALQLLFVIMVLAGAVKAGMMPFHGWLPSAMVAPTPVSALLHAVAVVKAGAFCVLRVVGFVFGPKLLSQLGVADVLAWFAAFTIIAASLIAIKQNNLKRRLAFSTVGQLSYVILGAALLAPQSILGGYYHIVAHAAMKITLFMCAGAIIVTTHKEDISDMHGLGRQMPITMACFTIASLGIAGMPLIIGFISKWNLALGALQVGKPVYIAVLICSALLSLYYLMQVVYLAYFKENTHGDFQKFKEADKFMLIPLCFTAAISIILGIVPNFGPHLYDLATMASQAITQGWIGGGW